MLILKPANSGTFNNVKMWNANEVSNASCRENVNQEKNKDVLKNCVKYNMDRKMDQN